MKEAKLNRCAHCGAPLDPYATACKFCDANIQKSQPQQQSVPQQQLYATQPHILQTLSGKIRILSIIQLVTAITQFLIFIRSSIFSLNQIDAEGTFRLSFSNSDITGLLAMLLAIINFICFLSNITYANRIPKKPVGIIKRYQSSKKHIFHAFLCFGVYVFGIIVPIYSFIVCNYVSKNEEELFEIEQSFLTQCNNQ